ncbi:DMT family transporter [Undibacterium hunanense]|uniref:DMT family transporter n=1 Tax=Undibacterium hunanense TaxID=2762292 RepID=UPI002E2FFAFC|nr:DMT family transporter [Undibacterium hunanense]
MNKTPVITYLKLVCVALFWGGTFIAGRLVAKEIPHMIAAFIRFSVASILLLLLAWRLEGGLPKLTRQQMHATFSLGATGIFLYNLCFFAALERMPAGRTALFVALNPIVTALALAMLFGERLSKIRWLGILIAFAGAAVVITRGDLLGAVHDLSQSVGKGELFMLAAICGWAAYTIIGRHALKGLSPIAATTYASLWGLLLLGIGAALEIPRFEPAHMSLQIIAALVYLGAFGTVIGFVWYYEGVKSIGPARTAVFNNLVPVFGISLGALILGEPILTSMIIGGLLVIAGVTLTNKT